MKMLLCLGGQLLINNQHIPLEAVDYKCCIQKSQWHGGGAMATSQGLHPCEILLLDVNSFLPLRPW
jgi:hypothetical protein